MPQESRRDSGKTSRRRTRPTYRMAERVVGRRRSAPCPLQARGVTGPVRNSSSPPPAAPPLQPKTSRHQKNAPPLKNIIDFLAPAWLLPGRSGSRPAAPPGPQLLPRPAGSRSRPPRAQKRPPRGNRNGLRKNLATCYSPAPKRGSTIAAASLDFRVRNENGYCPRAMVTRKRDAQNTPEPKRYLGRSLVCPGGPVGELPGKGEKAKPHG